MPIQSSDIALFIYVAFMLVSLIICYLFGSKMIEKTGFFGAQIIIAITLNFFLDVCAILGWFFFSWRVNEFLFFGGLVLGIGMLVISEAILILVFFIKRKKILQNYNANLENKS